MEVPVVMGVVEVLVMEEVGVAAVVEGVETVGGGLMSRFHPRHLPTCGGCLLLSRNTLA